MNIMPMASPMRSAYSFASRRSRRGPIITIRTSQWPRGENDAIQTWRGMTTFSPRRTQNNEHQQIRNRDNQPRSTDSLRSDASFSSLGSLDSGSSLSSWEDPASPSKKSRDVAAHLKYLVRGFLRKTRATRSTKDDGRMSLPNNEFFVPSPKVTFLIDDPRNLICQICQQTPLKLARTAEDPEPSIPAILPCGHICCHKCLSLWFANHSWCPFCRTDMIHRGCKHQVQPHLIAQDTIHTIPETLANGGKIADMCFKCSERDRREASVQRLTELAETFKAARRKAEALGTDAAIEKMHKAQQAFERVPETDYWMLSNTRHHEW